MKLDIFFDSDYINPAQKIRVMTEGWVSKSVFCPNCGSGLSRFENNAPVADFYCKRCAEEYELKSKHGEMGKKIVDGAYSTMIERLKSDNNPNFFFLTYDKSTFETRNFLTIPKYFFVPAIIEKRKALSPTARRAGWVGCNIDVSNIPELGKIFFVQNGVVKSKDEVLEKWSKTDFVKTTQNIESKGWLLDVLMCVEKITTGKDTGTVSLQDVYAFEGALKAKHTSNHNGRAKVRQQLQILRDKQITGDYGVDIGIEDESREGRRRPCGARLPNRCVRSELPRFYNSPAITNPYRTAISAACVRSLTPNFTNRSLT